MYIRSIEMTDYKGAHRVEILENVPPNKVLARLHPPLPADIYDTVGRDVDLVVLAPRYRGDFLDKDEIKLPTIVNICIAQGSGSSLTSGPWSILDIGEISEG
jgi:hypothetical protein